MRVLLTGAFRYPDGDAAAFRVASVASLFRSGGAEVVVAGWETAVDHSESYMHGGVRCFPQAEFRERSASPATRLLGFARRGDHTMAWLREQPSFDVIVAYNPPARFAASVLQHCAEHGRTAVLDSTEWYDSRHLPAGRFGPAAVENWYRMHSVYPRYQHVIAISTWLERYYEGRNVMRLPPLLALGDNGSHADDRPPINNGIRLVYAGQAGRKDRLGALLRALPRMVRELSVPVRLTIAGMSDADMTALCASDGIDRASLSGSVRCLGRISRDAVASLYRRSHFSVLFRTNARYAWAGFPTKAVESWANGCPIICNPVGDLASMAEHNVDALVVTESQLADRLPRMLASVISDGRFAAMSQASVRTAQQRFSPDTYAPRFSAFVARLRGPAMRAEPVP